MAEGPVLHPDRRGAYQYALAFAGRRSFRTCRKSSRKESGRCREDTARRSTLASYLPMETKGLRLTFGTARSCLGFVRNSRKQGLASQRAQRFALWRRALSVAIPVFAYICRYSLEMKMKASRSRSLGAQRERCQIAEKL